MGAEKIEARSRSNNKKEDAMKLGAHEFIATWVHDRDWFQTHSRTLDLIISTVFAADMPLDGYLSLSELVALSSKSVLPTPTYPPSMP